jgi:DNA processing protein
MENWQDYLAMTAMGASAICTVRFSDFVVGEKTAAFRDPQDLFDFLLQTRKSKDLTFMVWRSQCEQLAEKLREQNIKWAAPFTELYPKAFYPLKDPPVIWTYMGEPAWRGRRCLAVVGSRRPTVDTLEWLDLHLTALCRHSDWVILSGGARGVDQRAHLVALRTLRPTIAILPSGLSFPYPRDLLRWRQLIMDQGGCFVSQFSPAETIRRYHFILRNQLIVALACGVFVVEANRKSGSRMTAQFATDQGRDLATLAVSPMAYQGLGSLDLIHDGAQMLRDERDLRMWTASLPDLRS